MTAAQLALPVSRIHTRQSRTAQTLPVLYEARGSNLAISEYVARHLEELRASVRSAGAALLRGFRLSDPRAFAEAASLFGGPLGQSYEGPSPRVALAPGVYTASEVWSALVVPEHAEMSYLKKLPRHLFFWCRRAAPRGGATTLVDARRVLARLDTRAVAPLREQPLLIRRRHARPRGLHDPFEQERWTRVFGTEDREQLTERALALGYAVYFERDGAVTLEQRQPAVRRHPVTREEAWLNHLLVFHRSAPLALLSSALRREGELRAALPYPLALGYRLLSALGYPAASDVRLGNGDPIPDELVAHVRAEVEEEMVELRWQAGDLLIVDNHLLLHGRRPFRGPREVIAAWSDARG